MFILMGETSKRYSRGIFGLINFIKPSQAHVAKYYVHINGGDF